MNNPYLFRNFNERRRRNAIRDAEINNNQIRDGGSTYGIPNPFVTSVRLNNNNSLTSDSVTIDPTILLTSVFAASSAKTKRSHIIKFNKFCYEYGIVNLDLKIRWFTIMAFVIYQVRNEYSVTSILQYLSSIINTAMFLEVIEISNHAEARARQIYHFARTIARRFQPRKAPPITANKIRELPNTVEKPYLGAVILWILSGLRYGSIKNVDHDCITVSENRDEMTIIPKANKVENEGKLKCDFRCNCNTRLGNEFCFFHNDNIKFPHFPWSTEMVSNIINLLGCSLHSARWTRAITLRIHEESLGPITNRANKLFFWSMKSKMFQVYSLDYELYNRLEFMPINGIIHRLNRNNTRVRNNNNNNMINREINNNRDGDSSEESDTDDPDAEVRGHMNDNNVYEEGNGRTRNNNHNGFGLNDTNEDDMGVATVV